MRSLVIAFGLLLVGVDAVKLKVHEQSETGSKDLEKVWEKQALYISDLLKKAFDLQGDVWSMVSPYGSEATLDDLKEQMGESAELFMNIADKNHDGVLDREEFFSWASNQDVAFNQKTRKGEGEGEGEGENEAKTEAKFVSLKKSTEIIKEILGNGKPAGDKWVSSGMKGHMCDGKFWAAAAKEYANRYPKNKPAAEKDNRVWSYVKSFKKNGYVTPLAWRPISNLLAPNPFDTCTNILPLQKLVEMGNGPDFFNWLGCYMKEAPKVLMSDPQSTMGAFDPPNRKNAIDVSTFYKQYHEGSKSTC